MSLIKYPMITQIHVKNYRSLADVTINLDKLTILVGPNGSGKSNIVDVLNFVRDILIHGLDSAIMGRHSMSSIRRWSPKGKPYDIYISLHFVDDKLTGDYCFELGSKSLGEYKVKSEKLTLKPENMKEIIFEIKKGILISPVNAVSPSSPLFENLGQTDLLLLRLATVIDPSKFFHFISVPRQFLINMGFYTIFPNILREPKKSSNPYPLDEDGQNIASVLKYLKRKNDGKPFLSIFDALSSVLPGLEDIRVVNAGGFYVVKLDYRANKEGDRRPSFDLAQESDGTLRMLGILTAIYQLPNRSLISIEEPELTIHPGALSVLCEVLNESSARNQVIITTHSPDLVSQFPASAFRVVEKIDGITHVGQISENQRRAINEKLFSPGDLMRIEGFRLEK